MKKATLLKVLNPVLMLLAFVQLVTIVFLLITYIEMVAEIHKWNGIALVMAALAHLILNWNWVVSTYFRKKKPRTA
jgi:hypothetical protein